MNAKITRSFKADIIEQAKIYAENQGISLSRLTEILLSRLVKGNYKNLEEYPVSDWLLAAAEGETENNTKPRSRKTLKKEYYESKK